MNTQGIGVITMQELNIDNSTRILCMTMVKDDTEFVDIWARYYASIFGASNCLIIDHASKDKTAIERAQKIGVQVITVPFEYPASSPNGTQKNGKKVKFDIFRFRFLTKLRSALREFYDILIMHDVDEVLVVPNKSDGNLIDFLKRRDRILNKYEVLAGAGVEIFHDPETESIFDPSRSVLSQRQHAYFKLNQCKPVIFQSNVHAMPHAAERPFAIAPDLWLLHLKLIDIDLLKSRQTVRLIKSNQGETGDKGFNRWSWSIKEIDEEFKRLKSCPQTNDDQRMINFLNMNFDSIEDGCFMINKKNNDLGSLFKATSKIEKTKIQSLENSRFSVSEILRSCNL